MQAGSDIDVVFVDHATETVEHSPLPHVQTKKTTEECVRLLGEMLLKLYDGRTIENRRVVIPVEFRKGKQEKMIKQ